MTNLAALAFARYKHVLGLVVVCVSFPGMGCNGVPLFDVDARGLDGTFLPGSTGPEDSVGQIKLRNDTNDPDRNLFVHYRITVPAEVLDIYDFRLNDMSINHLFYDLSGGVKEVEATLPETTMACFDVYLKVQPTMDLRHDIGFEFINPNPRPGTSSLIRRVTSELNLSVFDDDFFQNSGVVPNQLDGPMFAAELMDNLMGLPVLTEIPGSATAQGTQLPEPNTQIFAAGYAWTTLGTSKAFPDFPCGAGTHAWTVCPVGASDLAEPDGVGYGFFTILVTEDIPLMDPVNSYVYSVVFDTDGAAANNWVASPNFPNDFFQGTDRWYEVSYNPTDGWALICSQVTDGASQSVVRDVPTAANAMIVGNALTLVIPDSEYMTTAQPPGVRYTAFRHAGDFGLNPPYNFSADVEPTVEDGLFVVQ